ncbi:hypothetical protein CDAR_99191 [Caerostris darwini]|uniref:Uncharacterized protein n=1 Tax=Caerostris darwini TaxID=1538125 RepID=A0AAV4Q4G2_9ARAC|nr:hypothetical protein CDAR_99191 [Caerostris darwini]
MLYACFNCKRPTIIDTKNTENLSTINFSHSLSLMAKTIASTVSPTTAASLSPQLRVIRNVSQCEICPALYHPGATSRPLAPPPRIQMALRGQALTTPDLN